jgi:hypothetical protein
MKVSKTLFNNIDKNKDMGIVRALVDSLYHLEKILSDMKLSNLYENVYLAKGSIINSKGETISLEYTFHATSSSNALSALEEYKSIMIKKGLRTWMAYWCTANQKGCLEYKCSLTEVMKWTSGETRESYFSQKEKEEFWSLTKMLEMTKLSRSKVEKRLNKTKEKSFIQWIEQPLIEVCGGERPLDGNCPINLAVRVLMPNIGKKSYVPASYKISTLSMNPNDIYLAFIIQTRASQMGHEDLFFKWDYLFEIGNLQQTAVSNPRTAKSKIRLKMDKLKKVQIVDSCDVQDNGLTIYPKRRCPLASV